MDLDLEKLSRAVETCNAETPISGIISLRENGIEIFARQHGYANRADMIPISANTRFGMASGCKTFTSVTICQLVEKGLIRFDTRIVDCLDVVFPRFDRGVTVHHLLSHTSGIPDYFNEETMHDYGALWKERPMYGILGPRDFLPLFQDQPMEFPPGERWAYNNAGYIVLGLIVEKLTGRKSFPRHVREAVLDPCGMADTGYFPMDQAPARVAMGYVEAGEGAWKTNIYSLPIVGGPDGGAFTTAADLDRFWRALRTGALVSSSTLQTMLSPHGTTDSGHYGYGVWIEDGKPGFTFQMVGEDPGVGFFSGYDPARDLQLTVMSNIVEPMWKMVKAVKTALGA